MNIPQYLHLKFLNFELLSKLQNNERILIYTIYENIQHLTDNASLLRDGT